MTLTPKKHRETKTLKPDINIEKQKPKLTKENYELLRRLTGKGFVMIHKNR